MSQEYITVEIQGESPKNLLELLQSQSIFPSSPCGGKGTCGKCKIQVTNGFLPITTEDANLLPAEELAIGWRLACKAYAKEDITIRFLAKPENDISVVSHFSLSPHHTFLQEEGYYIGIDIGTTTIAMVLLHHPSNKELASQTLMNPQRVFGADVISRIQASREGKMTQMRDILVDELNQAITLLLQKSDIAPGLIQAITIAGNTTMLHLLQGYSCEGLGVSPFTPVTLSYSAKTYKEVFQSDSLKAAVILLPGISAFVGADIVSGLFSCGFHRMKKPSLFIDLGTNGEMAIGNGDRILCASVAAGPAFEGGNITWGVGSIPGAISQVQLTKGVPRVRTIGNKLPVGICGTGALELLSELRSMNILDQSGLFQEPYFTNGFEVARNSKGQSILFTQKDVRELQLAIAAIRAGFETLLLQFGVPLTELEHIYLAGGFGFNLPISKAVFIGLLPEQSSEKIITVGNSSLSGTLMANSSPDAEHAMLEIITISSEIQLANDDFFKDSFLRYLSFPH